jgi:hypothetical protein
MDPDGGKRLTFKEQHQIRQHGFLFDPSMEESLVPSLSSGVVGSRFVTQDEIESVKARREEQWKAAYARLVGFADCKSINHIDFFRLGQEPPAPQQEDSYDGRSLAEVSKVISMLTFGRIHFFLLVAMWPRNLLRIRFRFKFSPPYVRITKINYR